MIRIFLQSWPLWLVCGLIGPLAVAEPQKAAIEAEASAISETVEPSAVAVEEAEPAAPAAPAEAEVPQGATKQPTPSETTYHKVRRGESLWIIAAENLGDGGLWPALYRANRDQIQNPKILYPGQELAIPNIAPEEKAAIRAEAAQLNTQ